MSGRDNGPKPRNYFNELPPDKQEEIKKLDAMMEQAERTRKIGEAQKYSQSLYSRGLITETLGKSKNNNNDNQTKTKN